jgi:transcriptional antiterminator RfaH
MEAIFLSMDGEQRVMLLLNILNRQQQISIPVSHLVA